MVWIDIDLMWSYFLTVVVLVTRVKNMQMVEIVMLQMSFNQLGLLSGLRLGLLNGLVFCWVTCLRKKKI